LSKKKELRWGTKGSKSVDLEKGVWFDHEQGRGGGPLDLIMREIGLTEKRDAYAWAEREGFWKNGAAPKSGSGAWKMVATYDYRDEGGALLYQKVRYAPGSPQRFSLRRPDGNGGWIKGLGKVRRVVYRLPDVVETIRQERTIYLVEGEKDTNNCWKIGVPATCNYDGGGKWNDQQTETFKGADVVVITDNDEVGRKHGKLVATKRGGVAKRLRVFGMEALWSQCPPKGDDSDWIEQTHGTAEAFYALIEKATPMPQDADKPKDILAELNRDNSVVIDGARTRVLRFEDVPHEAGGERYTY
jgi:hypothetical protein